MRVGLLTMALVSAIAPVACGAVIPTDPTEAVPAALSIVSGGSSVAIEQEFTLVAELTDASGRPINGAYITWSTSDPATATVSPSGRVKGMNFGAVTVRAVAEGLVAERTVEVIPGSSYSALSLSYFRDVAFGAEYGSLSRVVRKWAGDLLIEIDGSPTPEDLITIEAVMSDLRSVMPGRRVSVVSEGANLKVHFAPESEFSLIDPNYQPTNFGFFWVWWGTDQRLVRSQILISSTGITQDARSHLVREEITQSLGLMNDSWRFPESIYYQGWTSTTEYTALDFIILEMLYRDEIHAGMTEVEAVAVLSELPRNTSVGSVAVAN